MNDVHGGERATEVAEAIRDRGGVAEAFGADARELAPLGITVNTVAPGFVPVERHSDVPTEVRDAYPASVPAGRMGTRADIAHAVSFLASEGPAS